MPGAYDLIDAMRISEEISRTGSTPTSAQLAGLTGNPNAVLLANGNIATVPPKTNSFFAGLTSVFDIVKQGYGLYQDITGVKKAEAAMTTVQPKVYNTVIPATAQQTSNTSQPIPNGANTIIIGAEKNAQGSQAVGNQPQDNNSATWTALIIGAVILIIVIVIARSK